MNTRKSFLRQINYRLVRCCANCRYYRPGDILYCWLHDNPTRPGGCCKCFEWKGGPVRKEG